MSFKSRNLINGQCWSAWSPNQRIVEPNGVKRKEWWVGLGMPAGGIWSQTILPAPEQSRKHWISFVYALTISFYALNGSALRPTFLHLVHSDGESVKSTAESIPIKPITSSLSTSLRAPSKRKMRWGRDVSFSKAELLMTVTVFSKAGHLLLSSLCCHEFSTY